MFRRLCVLAELARSVTRQTYNPWSHTHAHVTKGFPPFKFWPTFDRIRLNGKTAVSIWRHGTTDFLACSEGGHRMMLHRTCTRMASLVCMVLFSQQTGSDFDLYNTALLMALFVRLSHT